MSAHIPLRLPTGEEIDQFERDGFVVLRAVLSPDALAPLRTVCARLIGGAAALDITDETLRVGLPPPDALFGAPSFASTLAARGHFRMRFNTARDEPAVLAFALGGAIGALVAALMRTARVRFVDDILFVKEPGTIEPTEWHDDDRGSVAAGPQRCSVWISLADVPLEAGPVQYLRGSHHKHRSWRDRGLSADALAAGAPHDILTCPIACGDIAVHDLDTLHAAGPNRSASTRETWSFRYAGEQAHFLLRDTRREARSYYGLPDGAPLSGPRFAIAWPVPTEAQT